MTDRRQSEAANAVDADTSELRDKLDILATFNDVVADVNELLVAASDREDIDSLVCERLVETDVLRFAWVGVLDEETGVVEPTTWAGVERGYLDEIAASVDEDHAGGKGPVGRALRTGTVQATQNIPRSESFESYRDPALAREYRSAVSVPLEYDGESYGVLTMYASHEGAFDEVLSEPLRNLGHAVAHGIDSLVRREREAELERRSEEFTRIVADVEDYAIFRVSDEGRIESWNRGAEEIKGYSKAEILGEHLRTFYTEEDRAERRPERLLEIARRVGRVEDEGWRVRADGSRFWASIVLTALTDDDGSVRGFTKVTRDMTERREREQQLDAVFNSTVQFMGLLDPDGTVLRVNDATLSFADLDRDDVVGDPAWETSIWDGDEERVADLKDAIARAADGEFVRYEVEVDGGDPDSPVILDFSISPVRDDDGEVALLVPEGRDITARKERERDLRRERERLEFMNRILRHNLLNGLNVVGARADILGDFVDEAGQTHLQTIRGRVDEMTDLVGTIRTFTKAVVDGETQEFEPHSLGETVDECVEAVRAEAPAATVDVGSIPDIPVRADDLLGEAIEHLLKNAVQHNDKAEPEVRVEAAAGDDAVELHVSDNGPGVADEDKRRIVDKSIEELSNPSSGFGLFIVREVVESYGGDVRIEDNDPEGATFVVTLPRP